MRSFVRGSAGKTADTDVESKSSQSSQAEHYIVWAQCKPSEVSKFPSKNKTFRAELVRLLLFRDDGHRYTTSHAA